MRRLTALIKKIVKFTPEMQDEYFKIAKVLDLMSGEWIPHDLPSGTSIFVEEGFLTIERYQNNQWKCYDFCMEGTVVATHGVDAVEMQEGSERIKATEPSRIYYLAPEDQRRVWNIVPFYLIAIGRLRDRSYSKKERRDRLHEVPPADRVRFVNKCFRSLFRAPFQDLVEFLGLKTEKEKKALAAKQKKWLSSKKQLSENYN
jgi:hypothetical protein